MTERIYKDIAVVPYSQKLQKIHDLFIEKNSLFPQLCCDLASAVVKEVIGLPVMGGRCPFVFSIDNHKIGPVHVCNYDEELGLYVDLTLSQFARYKMVQGDSEKIPPAFVIDKNYKKNIPDIAIYSPNRQLFVHDEKIQEIADNYELDILEREIIDAMNG